MSDHSDRPASASGGIVVVLLTLVGWSSVPLFLRHFAESIDAWTSNGWRYGFSAVLWAPLLLLRARGRGLPEGLWRRAIVPSVVNALGQTCFTWAHYRIDPGLLTFGLRSQIVFVALGAYLLFPAERPTIRSWRYLVGAALVVVGTAVTVLAGRTGAEATAHLSGVLLALGAGLLFALYGLSVRRFMHGVPSVVAFAAICQLTAAAMVGSMLLLGVRAGATALDLGPGPFALLLASAVIGIALGHVFYYIAIARLGVAVAAGVIQLQPFLVATGSMILFDERLTPTQWIGGAVAITGAALMLATQHALARARRRAAAADPVPALVPPPPPR